MRPEELTTQQLENFTTLERVCSTLSLLGCAWVVITFASCNAFHKPINRLVFFACLGNILGNVGTLISRSALGNINGALCQFQAFLIQMFLPADAYWTLAMAANVYLTFYWKFDASKLRHLEKYYIILCYGIPFLPAFVYIFVKSADRQRMYGNATLWCWIDAEWDVFRIATFYGPVWVVIFLTVLIYVRAGKDIYTKRKNLRNFSGPVPQPLPMIGDPFQSIKTTEVFVTSEAISPNSQDPLDLEQLGKRGPVQPLKPSHSAYTVTISTQLQGSQQSQPESPDHQVYEEKQDVSHSRPSSSASPTAPMGAGTFVQTSDRSRLFPSRRHAANQADNAIWSYTKVAVLFFIAMMVTWIPSSANRVYSVIHSGEINLGLEYASAFVLPLQGFWNAVIYSTTSLNACKQFWGDITRRNRNNTPTTTFGGGLDVARDRTHTKWTETDSMTELQPSRPMTKSSA